MTRKSQARHVASRAWPRVGRQEGESEFHPGSGVDSDLANGTSYPDRLWPVSQEFSAGTTDPGEKSLLRRVKFVENYFFLENYVTSERAVSHNVLYHQPLPITRYQVRFLC